MDLAHSSQEERVKTKSNVVFGEFEDIRIFRVVVRYACDLSAKGRTSGQALVRAKCNYEGKTTKPDDRFDDLCEKHDRCWSAHQL